MLEVLATDRGSIADIQGWAKTTGHQYIGTKDEGSLLKHYLRKADPSEAKEEKKFPHMASNEELEEKLNQNPLILDVREQAEYAFHRIPQSINIPLGFLEERLQEIELEREIYVICRTGNRSDYAAQLLSEKGYEKVQNVVPGMSHWDGPIEKDN